MGSGKAMTRRDFLHASSIAGGTLVLEASVGRAAVEGFATQETANLSPHGTPSLRVRPVVVRRGPEQVAVVQQFPVPPLAYFEKEACKIYVDSAYRDEIAKLLNARVSETGIWTFGAGNLLTEQKAKEVAYDKWDKTKIPQIGDFRIKNRSYATVRWEFNAVPVYESNPAMWWEGDPIQHGQRVGREMTLGREDYMVVGICQAYTNIECTRFVGKLDVLNWVAAY